ncbi:MAG: glycoside hydrolase family 2 TIM barrel-domain containing protein, partial [Gemmatimonadota bacterium]
MADHQPRRLLLNGEWEFAAGPDGALPATGWHRVRVPHRSREFEASPPDSGWYRTTVPVPEEWAGAADRLVLDLGRVRHFGRACLDGEEAGEHWGMRLPWRLDLTGRIAPGQSAELVVYTHGCAGEYAHPSRGALSEAAERALDTRFWYTSAAAVGLEGDVWLERQPALRIEEVRVVTSVRQRSLVAEVAVRNDGEADFRGALRLAVTRRGEQVLPLPEAQVSVPPGSCATVRAAAPWPDPVLWGHPPYGDPVLYFLRAELVPAGSSKPMDRHVTRFGFREVWAEGDRLLLNGTPLMLWGDHSTPYVYERQWLTRKPVDMAASGLSVAEHHRYDPPPVFYEVADELGVFVVASNFCVGTGQVPGEVSEAERDLVLAHHLAVLEAWMRRSRNHPSILFWDVTDARDPAFCVPLLERARQLDDTRILEVTFDQESADERLVELIGCYRLFSSLEKIEAAIAGVRSDPRFPVKPVRVGEAGIFRSPAGEAGVWGPEEDPPLMPGWWDFLARMPERHLHGLQTFYLTDMDYRGFALSVPGSLAAPLEMEVTWPSQSGLDARIDPFGEGTAAARGKARLYLNWCDPEQPVSAPTRTRAWSRNLFRRLTGREVGPLAATRVPEVLVRVTRAGRAVPGALVFAEAEERQGMRPWGVRADGAGTSWFV